MKKVIHILGIGSPIIDSLAYVSDEFIASLPGEKGGMECVDAQTINTLIDTLDTQPIRSPGGSAANTIFGLAKLGLSTAFLGKIGNDKENTSFYQKTFSQADIDISRFKFCDTNKTGHCLVLITPDSQRTCRTYLGASQSLSIEEIQTEDFRGITHTHVEGYLLFNYELTKKILHCAKEVGASISFDLSSFEVVNANRQSLDTLLSNYVDMVFANEDEARAYSNGNNPTVALEQLGRHCDIASVKLGPKGALLKKGKERCKIDAIKVNSIDSTAAGDMWAAGFLYGVLNGTSLKTAGQYASLAGAEVVQVVGAAMNETHWERLKNTIMVLEK